MECLCATPPASLDLLSVQLEKVKINPPNLNTLPPEVVIMIIRILDDGLDGIRFSEERGKKLCAYSRISPNFKVFAQEAAYLSLGFGSNEQIFAWLESDSTMRSDYETTHLCIKGSLSQGAILRLVEVVNRGRNHSSLRSFIFFLRNNETRDIINSSLRLATTCRNLYTNSRSVIIVDISSYPLTKRLYLHLTTSIRDVRLYSSIFHFRSFPII